MTVQRVADLFDGFRRKRTPSRCRVCNRLRIQQQIIYPPPRSNSTWSAIFAATATPAFDAFGIFRSANNVVAHTRQIAHPAASNQDHRVFLQVVPLARDVSGYFDVIGKAHASHFAKRRIRLLRRHGTDLQTNASLLRRAFLEFASSARERITNLAQRRSLRLLARPLSRFSYQLIEGRQCDLQMSNGRSTSIIQLTRRRELPLLRNR